MFRVSLFTFESCSMVHTPWVMMTIGVPLGWGGARKRSPRSVTPSTAWNSTRFEVIVSETMGEILVKTRNIQCKFYGENNEIDAYLQCLGCSLWTSSLLFGRDITSIDLALDAPKKKLTQTRNLFFPKAEKITHPCQKSANAEHLRQDTRSNGMQKSHTRPGNKRCEEASHMIMDWLLMDWLLITAGSVCFD